LGLAVIRAPAASSPSSPASVPSPAPVAATVPAAAALTAIATAAATPAAAAAAPCTPASLSALHGDTLRLATIWQQRHPCLALPTCAHADPIATLRTDLDDSPGVERVIGDRRFGIALLSSTDAVLATSEPDANGCWGWPDDVDDDGPRAGGQGLHLSTRKFADSRYPQIVARTRTLAHCGELKLLSVLQRTGDDLTEILGVDEEGKRGCSVWESNIAVSVDVIRPGEVVIRRRGRYHRLDSDDPTGDRYLPWDEIRDRCTLRVDDGGMFVPQPESYDNCAEQTAPR
jgi:hypothetical protein